MVSNECLTSEWQARKRGGCDQVFAARMATAEGSSHRNGPCRTPSMPLIAHSNEVGHLFQFKSDAHSN